MDKIKSREQIFRHLDGVVTVPVSLALYKKGVLSFILERSVVNMDELSQQFDANKGYLNVACRVLASQGFLNYTVDTIADVITISTNERTSIFVDSMYWYEIIEPITRYYDIDQVMGKEADAFHLVFDLVKEFVSRVKQESFDESSVAYQMIKHVEGYLISPMIVKLGMSGMFHKYFMESSFRADEFHKQPEIFEKILDFFSEMGWFIKANETYQFTEEGLFYTKRATSYGVTVSYLTIFLSLDSLLFGKAGALREIEDKADEIHVDRAMNVWGSGGAHATYFKAVDELIIEIFNKPLNEQPKGILDMGCGNGALLEHLFETIENRTLRGEHLETDPLFLVGADYNQEALKITRANLITNDIWAKVIWGDIGNPVKLAEDLKDEYNIELNDLLNMRTFLDHNRIWEQPLKTNNLQESLSTGAYATNGILLPNEWVEQSLVEHFQKWQPFISKFGLLVIELHTLDPNITSKNIGFTAATAYDATHGFSDQYILELAVFEECVKRSGLSVDENYTRKYPADERANISIHLIK